MTQRDAFNRSSPTASLAPSARRTGPLQRPEVIREALRALIEKGRGSLARLEPRVEVLVRACQEAELAIPGLGEVSLRHPVAPKGDQMVRYLVHAFEKTPALKRPVQVTIFRFYDARNGVDEAERLLAEGLFDAQLLEDLKVKLYSLTRSHADFQHDKLLSQLFPGPRVIQASGEKPLSDEERMRLKMEKESYLLLVETFETATAQRVAMVREVMALLARQGAAWQDVFSPQARQARLAAMRLIMDKPAQEQLRGILSSHEAFLKALNEVRRGGREDVKELKIRTAAFHQSLVACRQHPLLKDWLQGELSDEVPGAS